MKNYIVKVVVKSFYVGPINIKEEEWEIKAIDIKEASKQASKKAKKQSWRNATGHFKEYTVTTIFNSDNPSDKLDFVTC